MPLVTERLYDESKPLFVARDVKFDGRNYKKGDEAPVKDMSHRTLMKYFRTGLFVHEVRSSKEESTPEVKVEELKVEATAEAPPKKRGRKKE